MTIDLAKQHQQLANELNALTAKTPPKAYAHDAGKGWTRNRIARFFADRTTEKAVKEAADKLARATELAEKTERQAIAMGKKYSALADKAKGLDRARLMQKIQMKMDASILKPPSTAPTVGEEMAKAIKKGAAGGHLVANNAKKHKRLLARLLKHLKKHKIRKKLATLLKI